MLSCVNMHHRCSCSPDSFVFSVFSLSFVLIIVILQSVARTNTRIEVLIIVLCKGMRSIVLSVRMDSFHPVACAYILEQSQADS